jgi:hypothetical protein
MRNFEQTENTGNQIDESCLQKTVPINKIEKHRNTVFDKNLIAFGCICIVVAVAALMVPSRVTVTRSRYDIDALQTRTSTSLKAGTRLAHDDIKLEAKDYIFESSKNANGGKIIIWDYAEQDGDYVEVFINGISVGTPFMLTNKPIAVAIPPGVVLITSVHVQGIRDGSSSKKGDAGITYAINYSATNTTFLNSAPIGGRNNYTFE